MMHFYYRINRYSAFAFGLCRISIEHIEALEKVHMTKLIYCIEHTVSHNIEDSQG